MVLLRGDCVLPEFLHSGSTAFPRVWQHAHSGLFAVHRLEEPDVHAQQTGNNLLGIPLFLPNGVVANFKPIDFIEQLFCNGRLRGGRGRLARLGDQRHRDGNNRHSR